VSKAKEFIKSQLPAVVIGLVISLICTAITLYVQRDHRSLVLQVEACIPVVSVNEEFADDITVMLGNTQVSSLYLMEFSLQNEGNRAIRPHDFEQNTPLRIIFPELNIHSCSLVEREPEHLSATYRVERPDTLALEPLLLNGGDRLSFRVSLLGEVSDPPVVMARVANMKEIPVRGLTEERHLMSVSRRLYITLWSLASIGIVIFLMLLAALVVDLWNRYGFGLHWGASYGFRYFARDLFDQVKELASLLEMSTREVPTYLVQRDLVEGDFIDKYDSILYLYQKGLKGWPLSAIKRQMKVVRDLISTLEEARKCVSQEISGLSPTNPMHPSTQRQQIGSGTRTNYPPRGEAPTDAEHDQDTTDHRPD